MQPVQLELFTDDLTDQEIPKKTFNSLQELAKAYNDEAQQDNS